MVGKFHPLDFLNGATSHFSDEDEVEERKTTTNEQCSNINVSNRSSPNSPKIPAKNGQQANAFNWRSELKLDDLNITRDQDAQFLSLIHEYEDIFAKNNSDLGQSNLMEHKIDTGDAKPIKQPSGRAAG